LASSATGISSGFLPFRHRLLCLRPIRLLDPLADRDGLAGREVLAVDVFGPLGLKRLQGVIEVVRDVGVDRLPTQPLAGQQTPFSADQLMVGVDDDRLKQANVLDGCCQPVDVPELSAGT
jgi:hypothetical protein